MTARRHKGLLGAVVAVLTLAGCGGTRPATPRASELPLPTGSRLVAYGIAGSTPDTSSPVVLIENERARSSAALRRSFETNLQRRGWKRVTDGPPGWNGFAGEDHRSLVTLAARWLHQPNLAALAASPDFARVIARARAALRAQRPAIIATLAYDD